MPAATDRRASRASHDSRHQPCQCDRCRARYVANSPGAVCDLPPDAGDYTDRVLRSESPMRIRFGEGGERSLNQVDIANIIAALQPSIEECIRRLLPAPQAKPKGPAMSATTETATARFSSDFAPWNDEERARYSRIGAIALRHHQAPSSKPQPTQRERFIKEAQRRATYQRRHGEFRRVLQEVYEEAGEEMPNW